MDNCIFCKIINKEIPAEIIYETEKAIAVLDIHPCARGHTMVLPLTHVETLVELPDNEIEFVFKAVKKVIEILQKSFEPEGFTIGINQKEAAGQAIKHLHIHIIPRWKNDGGGSIHSVVHNPPKESIQEIRNIILNNIKEI